MRAATSTIRTTRPTRPRCRHRERLGLSAFLSFASATGSLPPRPAVVDAAQPPPAGPLGQRPAHRTDSRNREGAPAADRGDGLARGGRDVVEPAVGFEPTTPALRKRCSTAELRGPIAP